VSYRSQDPDEATENLVKKKLQENNIDVSQLVEYKIEHCQEAEPSTEGGSPPKTLAE
jgi:hypothetical protein